MSRRVKARFPRRLRNRRSLVRGTRRTRADRADGRCDRALGQGCSWRAQPDRRGRSRPDPERFGGVRPDDGSKKRRELDAELAARFATLSDEAWAPGQRGPRGLLPRAVHPRQRCSGRLYGRKPSPDLCHQPGPPSRTRLTTRHAACDGRAVCRANRCRTVRVRRRCAAQRRADSHPAAKLPIFG